jgi:predicted MPP superfamily phosphohydrolase
MQALRLAAPPWYISRLMSPGRTTATAPRGQRRAIILFVALLLTLLSTCWTVVGTLLAPTLPGGGRTVLGAALLFTAIPLATLVGVRVLGLYPGALVRLLVFRPFWYAQFFVLLLTLAGTAGALLGLPFGHAGEVGREVAIATGAAFVAFAIAGYAGSRRIETRRFVATLPDLPAALEGLTIAQISDLHVGPHTSRPFLERVARAVHDASPELIAVTGDLIDDFPADVDCYGRVFGSLAAPLGVYAIPGNHEVYAGWDEVRARLERLPLTVLVNRSVSVTRNGSRLAVVGTGDPAFGPGTGGDAAPDIERALAGVPPDAFVLALAHNPALWPALAARKVGLTLSGHTHWGQLAFPRLGWSLANPFLELAMGAHTSGESLLHIHPGSGYWGLPFRLGHASQVAIIELRRGERAALLDV